jgi:hypothetical protein
MTNKLAPLENLRKQEKNGDLHLFIEGDKWNSAHWGNLWNTILHPFCNGCCKESYNNWSMKMNWQKIWRVFGIVGFPALFIASMLTESKIVSKWILVLAVLLAIMDFLYRFWEKKSKFALLFRIISLVLTFNFVIFDTFNIGIFIVFLFGLLSYGLFRLAKRGFSRDTWEDSSKASFLFGKINYKNECAASLEYYL